MSKNNITHMEDSVLINAPIKVVFEYMADFNNVPKWHENMISVGWKNNNPPGVGSEYEWIETFAGSKLNLDGIITAWQPPYSYSWKATKSRFGMTGGWTFVEQENGTMVTRYSDSELTGIFKLLNALFLPKAKRQVKRELLELKRLIEAK
ncbi:MAG TPA: SRPBCC family protein [Saprospiraceae bacterium]|nr:SRPBCC family protein [Candidatus Parvibacillus calidus]MBX2937907.1 SRPBCC family protein [Saprospiraceae bacterium]MBX7178835.1 SRPBCC family protein [Saprospiraceae bacterium]MCB0591534.1 SRPBCC family protein [Saprospiraceae bacterium]MCC7149839.1 SRPBCC family protein [Saprospiraceae bacterium]